jgi:hypothetical protein
MWSAEVVAMVLGTFLLAGLVKGIVGFGLPIVALAMLANTLGLKTAIGLIVVPGIVMNIWQATVGGAHKEIFARIWPMLILACVFVFVGVNLLAHADARLATGMFGVLLVLYTTYSLARAQITPPRAWEPWLTPLIGALSGIAFGLTGSLLVPGVIYLQALGFDRNMLVQSLGITFMLMTSFLAVSLSTHDLLPVQLGLLSALALIPAALGMAVGQRLRRRISEEMFRKIFFWALLADGLYMIARAVL